MKKIALALVALILSAAAAIAQPGPQPNPWIVSGNQISYAGSIIVGNAVGGAQGPGTINAQAIYVNGVPVGSGGGGSVSTVSVTTANGFAGTVANATTTPAITVKTTITGILKGNGTAVSAATAGTDYIAPTGSGAGLTGITWSQIGSTPTTVAGYGISNALVTTNNLSDLASASSARSNLGLGTFATQNFATPPAIGAGTPAAGSFTVLTVTGSFTATGLVTNADLANASTTVNGQTCTLGSSCTITASAGTISVGVTTVASGTNGYLLTDNAGTLGNVSLASLLTSPPPIGGSAPAAGAFTTLSASSTVSGTGFSTYLASPPAIGGAAPAAGAFTNLSASGTVSGIGFSNYLASPPAIGTTAPAAGAFTTLAASSTVSGAGFTALFASPPAIGGTAPAAGSFTTLVANGAFTAESTNAIPSNGASGEGIFFFNTIASFGIYGGAGTPTVNAPTGSFYLDHTAGIPYYNTSSGSSGTTWTQVGTGSGSGCTVAGGSQYQILVNNGSSGCSSSLNASVNGGALALGSSGTPGSITLGNSASGTLQLVAVTGALGTAVAQFPANNGVVAETNLIQTWTAGQLFANGDLQLLGSSTGITSLFSDNGGASNFTIHVPAVNGTMATTANINSAIPSATSSQIYVGTGAAGAAAAASTLPTGAMPALTGDVTNSAGSLATTVGAIGGHAVSLAGSFTVSGAFGFTGTLTNTTNVTFPTSGTLATTANINTALPSATTSQLYGGSGGAGVAQVVTVGSGLTISGGILSITGSVTSVTNSDGSLTISPTSGAVVASLNVAHANTFSAAQTFTSNVFAGVGGSGAYFYEFYNVQTYPSSNAGLAMGWNFSGGNGESTIWNTNTTAAVAFAFYQKTGASAATTLMTISATGSMQLPHLATSGTIANSICTDSTGKVIAVSGVNCFAGGGTGGTAGVYTKTTNYPLNYTEQDNNVVLEMNCSSACTLTIQASPTIPYATHMQLIVMSINTGVVNIAVAGGATIASAVGNSPIYLAGIGASAVLYNGTGTSGSGSSAWYIAGNIAP